MHPSRPSTQSRAQARFAGVRAREVVECVDVRADPERIAAGGWWAVVGDFDGPVRAWHFAEVEEFADEPAGPVWHGPARDSWRSSLDEAQYRAAVSRTREHIRAGDVYQANICRVLRAPLPATPREPDPSALHARLVEGNPAPYAGFVHVPQGSAAVPAWVVTASPELFLSLEDGVLASGPIKGTARVAEGLLDKDRAENVMITDLVRNDLQRVCEPGTVDVTALLRLEQHPGLVHLVSRVEGALDRDVADDPALWARVLGATYPPGSVSGAPKSSALRIIAELERGPRGPYCGVVGWIDSRGRTPRARLAVGIRTFSWADDELSFGTGAGITWGSDPVTEWAETELKASLLVALASSG